MAGKDNGNLVLCIDPSVKDLGFAWFDVKLTLKKARLRGSGHYRCRGMDGGVDAGWDERIDESVEWLYRTVLRELDERASMIGIADRGQGKLWKVVMEMPQPFGGGVGGRGDAAKNTGATLKLMAQVWAMRQMLLDFDLTGSVKLVEPSVWKGQKDKEVTMRRNRRHWKWEGSNHNESDAVGIGDWYIRKFLEFKIDG